MATFAVFGSAAKDGRMTTISFPRHPFPPDIIGRAARLYLRFTLTSRDVEDLFAE
jgi:putative transposase